MILMKRTLRPLLWSNVGLHSVPAEDMTLLALTLTGLRTRSWPEVPPLLSRLVQMPSAPTAVLIP
jgi:hypothetical protein